MLREEGGGSALAHFNLTCVDFTADDGQAEHPDNTMKAPPDVCPGKKPGLGERSMAAKRMVHRSIRFKKQFQLPIWHMAPGSCFTANSKPSMSFLI